MTAPPIIVVRGFGVGDARNLGETRVTTRGRRQRRVAFPNEGLARWVDEAQCFASFGEAREALRRAKQHRARSRTAMTVIEALIALASRGQAPSATSVRSVAS
jgi:hypothetical protein